jgi:hypothetical protein
MMRHGCLTIITICQENENKYVLCEHKYICKAHSHPCGEHMR